METKTKITQRDIILWHLQNVGTLCESKKESEGNSPPSYRKTSAPPEFEKAQYDADLPF